MTEGELIVGGGAPTIAPARPEIEIDEGDHERFAHIVLEGFKSKRGKFIPAGNNVVEGMVNSTPVRALCGKVWVPGRDASRYPLCPTCREVAASKGWKVPQS
jgi:hypothetical protein